MNKLTIIKTTFMVMKNFTYMIENINNNNTILIDPAWEIEKYIAALKKDHLKLIGILLTHHHMDHTNLAGELAVKYDCPVYMFEPEIDYYKFSCANLQAITENTDILNLGGIVIKVIPTPGHTFGGACFMIDDMLFSGDTLFIDGCGMCNIDGGDPRRMYASLEKLKQIIPDKSLVYPGHQYHYKIGKNFQQVKEHNVYLQFKNIDEFVKFRMRRGQRGLLNFT